MPPILALGLLTGIVDLVAPPLAALLAWPLKWCLWWLEKANAFFAGLPNAITSTGPVVKDVKLDTRETGVTKV